MKTHFFPRQAIPKILLDLHSHYTGDTSYRVWFDVDNSLPDEQDFFLKFLFHENQNVPYENTTFFLSRLNEIYFLLYTLIRQAIPKILFALHSRYTVDTQYGVWFDLDNSLTRWKWIFFNTLKNSQFAKFAKILYENPIFFLGKLYQRFFLLWTLITLVILRSEFGLIWTTPWPKEKELFIKFSKIRNSRNSQNSVWKPIFFLDKLYQKLFWLYTLITLVILHTAFGLMWTTPCPMNKTFFKNPFSRKSKCSVWKHNFFPKQAKRNILFALYSH